MGIIGFFSRLFNLSKYSFGDLKDSEVNIYENCEIIERPNFELSNEWFKKILDKYYDEEIKSKYIPVLHQDTRFEDLNLLDILDFEKYLIEFCDTLNNVASESIYFRDSFNSLNSYLETEKIYYKKEILEKNIKFKDYPNILFENLQDIQQRREIILIFFNKRDYSILEKLNDIEVFDLYGLSEISYRVEYWNLFLEKEPNHQLFYHNFRLFNTLIGQLQYFNNKLDNFKNNYNYKIIAGAAGTGKSHYLAYLVDKVTKNKDLVIFLKPKSFSGDNVNFEERLLELLQVPKGYILSEVLEKLNEFSKNNNERCFIFIDALNETTKSSIGFSNIWKIYLQSFINQVKSYPHLYFVCSLRTSYVEMIWDSNPNEISEIKGFENRKITTAACEKYFDFYKIVPTNIKTADVNIFRTPLLLDLFCKLTNSEKESVIEISIDIESYLKIFQDYLKRLIKEVKDKLDLASSTSIENGFSKNSELFYNLNQDVLTLNQFVDSFDSNPNTTNDKSIAKSVLEGHLIFVKEILQSDEIIKHTYQEVGGFLIAKKLSEDFSNILDLVISLDFKDKIIGNDISKHHQLRLDILKFLIALRPEIIKQLNDDDSLKLSWWFIFNKVDLNSIEHISENLINSLKNDKIFDVFLDVSSNNWFNSEIKLNFEYIGNILSDFELWDYDLKWTFFLYRKAEDLDVFIGECIEELENKKYDLNIENEKIIAKFISHILSTTVRDLRDKATIYLIKYGTLFPLDLLDITIEFSGYKDIYIYERLCQACYGVLLIRQNDKDYTKSILPEIANKLYAHQFSEQSKNSKFNYIVVDSIKHILDFAILRELIDLTKEERQKIYNYEFKAPYEWIPPTEEQQNEVDVSHETSWPEPIGMDFGIYTIPRLVKREDENRRIAIANVYKRIFELGFVNLDLKNLNNELFKEFIRGHTINGIEGKVDKLGKKYNWNAFFDYAGYLLLNKKLNVFEKTENGKKYYDRLTDVDIDVSLPNTNYDINLKLYSEDLFDKKDSNPKWYEEIKIDSIKELFETKLQGEYSMLYGFVEQRTEDYKVRSFLMVETLFVEKNEDFKKIKKESDFMSWDSDIHVSRDHGRHSYFGELYWADTIPDSDKNKIYIPTGEKITYKRKRTIYDIFRDEKLTREDVSSEIEEISDATISFNSEATLIDYLWESDSKLLKGFGEYFPSSKMGKHLNLKADCSSGKILDKDLKEAYKCIHYEDKSYFKNTFNYMRSDLIKKYMKENNLALVYQIKQHSYDENLLHNRKLKFFIVE
jgi:hypothetical protein